MTKRISFEDADVLTRARMMMMRLAENMPLLEKHKPTSVDAALALIRKHKKPLAKVIPIRDFGDTP